jgi:phosphohistidine phosphatase SixA
VRVLLRLMTVGLMLLGVQAVPAHAQGHTRDHAHVHAAAPVTTVILVRHAEKVDDSRDPALNALGLQRAEALAAALADAGVDVVMTTQFQRTRDTAAPLAAQLGIAPTVIESAGAGHAADVAARVREHPGCTVVVVGHSNTIPAIIAALGGPELTIEDDEYFHLFVLHLSDDGVRLIRSRY